MHISSIHTARAITRSERAKVKDRVPKSEKGSADTVELTGSSPCQKVYGSVGAMTGALSGRVLTALAGGAALGLGVGFLGLGGLAVGVGAAVGLAAGAKTELKTKVGRVLGGMVGGVVGSALGWAADKLGLSPSEELAKECQGFSVRSLPAKLKNPDYTSHKKLSGQVVEDGIAHTKPGDIIVTNNDGNFMLELMQKATGGSGDWTHTFLVGNDGKAIDILVEDNEPREVPLARAFEENEHAKILRPRYQSPESAQKAIAWSQEQFGKITYDTKFDLDSKDAMYCQEYIYNALREGAPEIELTPRKALGFKPLLTADEMAASKDMDEVWSTGSNFWVNWLSHFN